jgi:hypothetical protein
MGYLYGIMAELRPSLDGAMVVLVSPSTCSNQHHDHTDMHMQHEPLQLYSTGSNMQRVSANDSSFKSKQRLRLQL